MTTTAQQRRTLPILATLSLGSLAFSALQSMLAPALSTIGQDLHASTGAVTWTLTAYLLAASVTTPTLGRLADLFGKRRLLLIVLVLLLLGTVLAALAPNLWTLVVARAIQGAAGAVMPLSISIVRDVLPQERVGAAIGFLSAIFGVGGGLGILVAGPILQTLGWRWLFWLPAALVIIAIIGAVLGLPALPTYKSGRVDIAGSATLGIGLIILLLTITEGGTWGWLSPATVGLLGLGLIVLAAFVLMELRTREPLIQVRSLRSRGVWTSHAAAVVVGFGMLSLFVLVPTLLELPVKTGFGFGLDPTAAGLLLLPAVLVMVVTSSLAGILTRTLGTRPPMVLGGLLLASAFALPGISHHAIWELVTAVVLAGAGLGFSLSAVSNAIISAVPADRTGEALATNTIARTIGSSIGTAIMAAAISTGGAPSEGGFTLGFWICATVGAAGVIVALLSPGSSAKTPHRTPLSST